MYAGVRRLLFRMDPERAHDLAFVSARLAQATMCSLFGARFRHRLPRLQQTILGLTFESPFGLAAGFDKNAELVEFWRALGFGFVEVGSVTAQASPGNPRPRAFRLLDDRALVNRMGLNNVGREAVAERLAMLPALDDFPIGINIAKTHDPEILGAAAIEDFCASYRTLAPHASYVALNVSCPNTREGKTFEDPDAFDALLAAIAAERARVTSTAPLLVKLSPPPLAPEPIPGQVDELVSIALERGVDGFIACNTAADRAGLKTDAERIAAIGRGGLSGAPVRERSSRLVAHLYRRLQGRHPIIGVGGVSSFEDALDKLKAGASLVEIYTGLVYEGPGLASRLAGQLDDWLADNNLELDAVVGAECDAARFR